jgi:TPR repeat protein
MKPLARKILFTGTLILGAHNLMAVPPPEDDSWLEGANIAYRPETPPVDLAALRQSAAGGDADAQNNLGFMYANGKGVPKDYAEAARWFRKAADQNYPDAQNNLGVMYNNGQGFPRNYAEAILWYRKAADLGDVKAQYNLGQLYRHGYGVKQDYTEAAMWYRKAADQDYAYAQHNFGVCYKNGVGVPRDNDKAYMWLELAASKTVGADPKKSAEVRDTLAVYMTPDQIARAKSRAREWVPGAE